MSALRRNNVHVRGMGTRPMVFVHGFGSDQTVWRFLAPCFERDFVTILLDNVGAGASESSAYSSLKYSTLRAYAEDLVEIGRELELRQAVIVGHSCGAMIAALASLIAPEMFVSLILIGPSARYIDDTDGYQGGFSATQVTQMLELLAEDYESWSARMAPLFMGNPERPELSHELAQSFRQLDAAVALDLARAIFHSDLRDELSQVRIKSLILQSKEDCIVPDIVAHDIHKRLPSSALIFLTARGHFPHLSAPVETVMAMSAFLKDLPAEIGHASRSPAVPMIRDLVRRGSSILSVANESKLDYAEQSYKDQVLELMLARYGELSLHLGRYDMYAVTLQDFLTGALGVGAESGLTLRTRGDFIMKLLWQLSPEISPHFVQTHLELQGVLERHEIAAHRGAVIPGLRTPLTQEGWRRMRSERDWFDRAGASADDCLKYQAVIERDVLKVVALCFRVCSCALAVQGLISPSSRPDQN